MGDLVTYTHLGTGGAKHPELSWVVGVVVPAGEAFAPANEVALALFGLAALVLIIASVAAFFLGRSITRPLDELVKTAREVGSGDQTGEVVIRTRDQIGSLAGPLPRPCTGKPWS